MRRMRGLQTFLGGPPLFVRQRYRPNLKGVFYYCLSPANRKFFAGDLNSQRYRTDPNRMHILEVTKVIKVGDVDLNDRRPVGQFTPSSKAAELCLPSRLQR